MCARAKETFNGIRRSKGSNGFVWQIRLYQKRYGSDDQHSFSFYSAFLPMPINQKIFFGQSSSKMGKMPDYPAEFKNKFGKI
jgi:hypothetical protein